MPSMAFGMTAGRATVRATSSGLDKRPDPRSEWLARQGLGGAGSLIQAVRRAGWLYQAGGTGPYLSLWARTAGLRRAHVDELVAGGELRICTSVRGCTMLVPAEQAPLARAAGQRALAENLRKTGKADKKARWQDVMAAQLAAAQPVLEALPQGDVAVPAATLRGRIADGPGGAGELPQALRALEAAGLAERVPASGRLDDDRYHWRRTRGPQTPALGEAELDAALAAQFLSWAAPVTAAELAAWAGISATAARQALAAASASADDTSEAASDSERVIFLPFRDNYVACRRGLTALLQPADGAARVLGWSNEPQRLDAQESLHHHAIVHRGYLVGIWEYAGGEVVCGFFSHPPRGWQAAAAALAEFVRGELGDVFIYGQDGPRQRSARTTAVRALQNRQ